MNSLWFLSLTVSLSGALVATLFRNWAVQYISVTQTPWYTITKRARTRALFAKENPGPYIIWGTGQEPTYLHFSLLLFIAGGLIYLFNINRPVFYAVVWWVGWITIYYSLQTLRVFFEPHTLFHTPLSRLTLRTYLGISYLVFQIFSCLPPLHGLRDDIRSHYRDLSRRYSKGILKGKRRETEEIALKPSSKIDALILERILLTLDEDHALETFFDAIPGFCDSDLCTLPLSSRVQTKFRQVLDGFLNRTFSSHFVSESVRLSRLVTCLNAAHAALESSAISGILDKIVKGNWDEAVEIGHALRLSGHGRDHDLNVRRIVACIIVRAGERGDRWTKLVKEEFGLPDHVLRDSLAHGDSVLLSILIHISRENVRAGSWTPGILSSLSKFDVHNTLPRLQHDFCTLWNEFVQEANNQAYQGTPAKILREIRHLYVALHRDTERVRTAFSDSTDSFDAILEQPSSYPLCDITSHRSGSTTPVPVAISSAVPLSTQPGDLPDASPHQSTPGGSTALRPAEETITISGLPSQPDLSTTSEIGKPSQSPTGTFPVQSGSPSTDRFIQDGVATVQPETTSAAKVSHPLERNEQQGSAIPCVAPLAVSRILSTVPATEPLSPPTAPALNKSSATIEANPPFIFKSLLPASSSSFFSCDSPDSPPHPHGLPLRNPEVLSLLSGMSPKGPSDNASQLRLHPHNLVNNGSVYLANAVLQSLVYCQPFRDLFRDQGQLVGQCERGETAGGATPLIDATVGFLNQYAYVERSSLTHQAARGKVIGDKDGNKEDDGMHSFLSTDMNDAMKEKRQFITMRVRSCAHVLEFCY